MQEMNQGDEYVEEVESSEEGELQYEEEGSEDTSSGFDTIFGIPKKAFILGAAVAVIVLVAIVVLIVWKKGSGDEDIPVMPGTDGAMVTEVYDAEGNPLGTATDLLDGSPINGTDGSVIGYIDSAGANSVYDTSGQLVAMYSTEAPMGVDTDEGYTEDMSTDTGDGIQLEGDNYNDDDFIQLEGDDYTGGEMTYDEDNVTLRKAGYTGDEIEMAKSLGIPTDTLVEEAKEAQDEALKKRLKKVSNKKSKEFLTLYNNSVFFMNQLTFDAYTDGDPNARNYTGTYTVNADYWKVPTYGHQLLIKCKIANDTYAFYCVSPDRWATLPEEGNIVLGVNYMMYGTANVNMYITSITEVETTHNTVNTLDSASSLEDILQSSDVGSGDELEYDGGESDGSGDGLNEPW